MPVDTRERTYPQGMGPSTLESSPFVACLLQPEFFCVFSGQAFAQLANSRSCGLKQIILVAWERCATSLSRLAHPGMAGSLIQPLRIRAITLEKRWSHRCHYCLIEARGEPTSGNHKSLLGPIIRNRAHTLLATFAACHSNRQMTHLNPQQNLNIRAKLHSFHHLPCGQHLYLRQHPQAQMVATPSIEDFWMNGGRTPILVQT